MDDIKPSTNEQVILKAIVTGGDASILDDMRLATNEEILLAELLRNGVGGLEIVETLPEGSDIKPKKIYELTKDITQGGKVYAKGIYYWDATEEEWKGITGGSGGKDTILVGLVDKDTAHLPTTRPDGSALVDGDYVKVNSETMTQEDLPITIDNITFATMKDTAIRLGGEWIPNANPFQKTAETPLSDPEHESLSGTENMQDDVNKEFVNYVKNKKAVLRVSTLPTSNIKEDTLYLLSEQKAGYLPGTYDYINGAWVRIDVGDKLVDSANIDFLDSYTYYNYVETTGEQYFETDLIPADYNHKIEMYLGVAFLEAKEGMYHGTVDMIRNTGYLLGCTVNNFSARFGTATVYGNIQGSRPMVVGTDYTILTNTVGRTDDRFQFATIYPGSWWYIDFSNAYSKVDESHLGSFILGGYKNINSSGTSYVLHKSRIYRLRVWEQIDGKEVLTHYYRPAKDANGNPGMYDTQTGKFFKAKGENLAGLKFSSATYLTSPTALVKTVDELDNNSPIRPLSARQGRILDDKKLDKVTNTTDGEQLYGKDADGTQAMYGLDADTLKINEDGNLEALSKPVEAGEGIIVEEEEDKVVVSAKVDDETIKTNADHELEVVTATEDNKGIVQPDGSTITIEDGVISAAVENAYDSLEPVGNIDETYLAYAEYTSLDYQYAREKLDEIAPPTAACSATVKDGKLIRNYDWTYSEDCEFVVRTPSVNNRHATIGMVGQVEGLTKDFVKSGARSELYKLVPFMLTDGKNDAGLKMSVNVVPHDKGTTTGTDPSKTQLNALMFIRWALDHFSTVDEVVAATEEVSIYVPEKMRDLGYELHFLVSDKTTTKVLEFVNNACVWKEHDTITNFFIDGVNFKTGGTVPVIGDSDIADHGLTNHAQGLERYNIIVNHTGTPAALLQALKYTNLYTKTSNKWYSELCGDGITISSPMATFTTALEAEVERYNTRTRAGRDTWQTVHSVIYDDESITYYTQEDYTKSYTYDSPKGATSSWPEITNKPFETLSGDLTVTSNALGVKKATLTDFGTVKPDGQTIRINETTGAIEAIAPVPAEFVEGDGIDLIPNPTTGEITIATKVDGETIAFDGAGQMKVIAGGHEPDETTIILDSEEKLKAVTATADNKGIVRPDNETITIENGVISAKGGSEGTEYFAGDAISLTDSEHGDLPEGYTRLNYVIGSTTAYLDTELTANQDTSVYIKCAETRTGITANQGVFGAVDSGTNRLNATFTYGDGGYQAYYKDTTGAGVLANVYADPVEISISKDEITIKNLATGETVTSTALATGNFSTTRTMYIGGQNSATAVSKFSGRIYSCKILQKGDLIRDYAPAVRDSDNKAGFYDMVNDIFYPATTGNFTAGTEYSDKKLINVNVDGETVVVNAHNKLQAIAAAPDIEAGGGITVEGKVISANVDGSTVIVNGDGKLQAIGGGGGTDIEAGVGIELGGEGGSLPEGYKRLDWLGSKTSYVKTGVIPTMNTSAEIIVRMPQIPSSGPSNVFGVVDTNRFYSQYSYSGAAWNAYFGTTANTAHLAPCYTDKVKISISADKVKVYDYDTQLSAETTDPYTGTFTVNKEIWLCGVNGSASGSRVNTRWYDCKIWQSGELIHHYVPALRESDSVVSFYDIVEDEFMAVETTAGFEAGPEYTGTKKVNVKIDNETITVDSNNVLHSIGGGGHEPDNESIILNSDDELQTNNIIWRTL